MTKQEVLSQIEIIFRKVLNNEEIHLTEQSTTNDVKGWDSLTHMIIIAQVENQFKIRFKFREIVRMKDIGELCDAVIEKAA